MGTSIPLQLQLEMLETGLMRARLCAYVDMTVARGEVRLTEVQSKVAAAKDRAKNGGNGADSDDDSDFDGDDEEGRNGGKRREKRKEKIVALQVDSFTGRSADISIGEYATIAMLKTEIVRKLGVPVDMQVRMFMCMHVCLLVYVDMYA
jgi:hypothetical protein